MGAQARPDQPLVFPLKGSSAKAPPAPPSQGSENPPSSGQPKPAGGGSSMPWFNTGSDTKRVNKPGFEGIFNYPAQGSGAPQSQGSPPQAAGGSSQGSPPRPTFLQKQAVKGGAQPSRPVFSRQSGYQPPRREVWHREVSWQQNPANANQSPQRQSAGVQPPVPPPSYIIQSSSGYQRFRKTYKKSKYTPEFAAPQSEGSPVLQPAAPPHIKGPQRYGHLKLNKCC